jgi:uncharacterized protein YjaZ
MNAAITFLSLVFLVLLALMLGYLYGFELGKGAMKMEANIKIAQALKLEKDG